MAADRQRCERKGAAEPQRQRWLDWLLPPVCLVCGDPLTRGPARVCELCWSRARPQRPPLCARCGISLHDIGIAASTSSCTECADWLPYLRLARAPYVMAGTAAAMVHALKYGGWRGLAGEMGARMAEVHLGSLVEREIAVIVPVPLSRVRQRQRGFNQAELLAASVAGRRGWPLLTGALVRGRHTRRQARLSPRERLSNVRGAFQVVPSRRSELEDRHLLLVDDVLTTAATAQDCVRALCEAGARAVSVLTFARARRELPRHESS